jgi:methyl-accepting chemotaxis protein
LPLERVPVDAQPFHRHARPCAGYPRLRAAHAAEVFRENAAARSALQEEARAQETSRTERQARVERQIKSFRSSVGTVLAAVGTSMNELERTATSLPNIASDAATPATSATAASE